MSFYYLSAVKGNMPIHLIETIIVKRLGYLKVILKGDNSAYNEFVIEGSVYDNVGYFMLCVVTILGGNTEFSHFILSGEIELFKRRLMSLGTYELRCFAKKILRTIKKYEDIPAHVEPLKCLCQHLMLKELAHHISTEHQKDCDLYNIKFNFRHCLNFIAKREVRLEHGTVYLPCGKWKLFLIELFRNNLKHRLLNTNLEDIKSDPRIMELLHLVKQDFFPKHSNLGPILLNKDVDKTLRHFPPCMVNLHQALRKKHRLSHAQRFYYSLFLKDIGMPVEEAISFWRAEYKQNPNGSHSCCHNWERDEKKYLYGIRHMYGLEGARKSYTSMSCQRIQSIENACSEGGCPFKSFDDSKMISLLKNPSNKLLLQINELKNKSQYTKSCLLYLNSVVETGSCDNLSFNFTPIKYYAISSGKSIKNV